MDQPDLFDRRPPTNDTATSDAAAEAIAPSAATLRGVVLAAIQARGDATDEEICAATGLGGSTVRPRRGELVKADLVVDSGKTRPTQSGRQAIAWVAAPEKKP